jgi:D-glycero-D-manno-heptose 1,7-bisphosphate phosphatase
MKMQAAFFLDRDGTINFDRVYLNDPGQVELIPGSAAAIRRIKDAGYLAIVVTNQSGVARGLIRPEALPLIHAKLDELLGESGAKIDRYVLCLHHPDDQCACRKPKPKLVLDVAVEMAIDLERSVFVGNMLTDIATGKNAGCGKTILVRTAKPEARERTLSDAEKLPSEKQPDHIADNLAAAVDWVLNGSLLGQVEG